jgi:hypothetical protein
MRFCSLSLISASVESLFDTYVLVYTPKELLDANEWLEEAVHAATFHV